MQRTVEYKADIKCMGPLCDIFTVLDLTHTGLETNKQTPDKLQFCNLHLVGELLLGVAR